MSFGFKWLTYCCICACTSNT